MRSEAKAMNDAKVRFDLWAVLGFLVIAGASSFTFLYAEGKETKLKQQEVIQRVTRLETQYEHIIKGLEKVANIIDESSKKLEVHRLRTEKGRNPDNGNGK